MTVECLIVAVALRVAAELACTTGLRQWPRRSSRNGLARRSRRGGRCECQLKCALVSGSLGLVRAVSTSSVGRRCECRRSGSGAPPSRARIGRVNLPGYCAGGGVPWVVRGQLAWFRAVVV